MKPLLKKSAFGLATMVAACIALLAPGLIGSEGTTQLATQSFLPLAQPASEGPDIAPAETAPAETAPVEIGPVEIGPAENALAENALPTATQAEAAAIEADEATPTPTPMPAAVIIAALATEPDAETANDPTPGTAGAASAGLAGTESSANAAPAVEPTPEPTVESTPEPTAEPTPEPTAEPTPQPTLEPVVEPTAEPTAESTPEPTAEPTPEPTAEPTPEPTVETAPAPSLEVDAGWMYVVSSDGLFLRDEPAGQITSVLTHGSDVYITGDATQTGERLWVEVGQPETGWVALSFLSLDEPAPPPETTPSTGPSEPPTAADWAAFRDCESGGRYDAVDPSGLYHGAYQFLASTWDGLARRYWPELVGVLPSQATAAEQDQMAAKLFELDGTRPWPTCGLHLL